MSKPGPTIGRPHRSRSSRAPLDAALFHRARAALLPDRHHGGCGGPRPREDRTSAPGVRRHGSFARHARTGSELAGDWMTLDRTTISTLVFRLEQQGLIERAVNGADRRARMLRLTPVGKALHDRVRPKSQAAQDRILDVLTAAERRAFIEMLDRVIEANGSLRPPGRGAATAGQKEGASVTLPFCRHRAGDSLRVWPKRLILRVAGASGQGDRAVWPGKRRGRRRAPAGASTVGAVAPAGRHRQSPGRRRDCRRAGLRGSD